jgi:dinuclear metal center YbgI/SA1388 family protein
MTLIDLNDRLNELFPPETAWSGDAIGLQIDRYPIESTIKRVLIAYEINEDILSEAIQNDVECICVFHPLIFSPLKRIRISDRIGSYVHELIRNNIGLIVIHTNFDMHPQGTNMLAAKALGLQPESLRPMIPDAQFSGFGMGMIGIMSKPIQSTELASLCKKVFGSPIRYCTGKKDSIQSIAIVCGSGTSYFQTAVESQVDCFITADVKYHQFHEAKGNIMLIDPGHAEMEQFVAEGMTSILRSDDQLQAIEFIPSKVHTSPIHYIS